MQIECNEFTVGIDEAGRGTLVGRVYAAAVILPVHFEIPQDIVIKDSKKMTLKQREKASKFIKTHALDWKIGYREEKHIDKHNITASTMEAIHQCLDELEKPFNFIIMDGNYFVSYERNGKAIEHKCIPKADDTFLVVSCASILAKNARDNYILKLCEWHPELNTRYDMKNNMGYPAPKHKQGIEIYGITQFHRTTYSTCKEAKYNPICTVLIDD